MALRKYNSEPLKTRGRWFKLAQQHPLALRPEVGNQTFKLTTLNPTA